MKTDPKPESFPSWVHHSTEPSRLLMTEAEWDDLPKGWADHPDRCAPDADGDGDVDEQDERAALAAAYKAKFGKAPHHLAKIETIRAKLAE